MELLGYIAKKLGISEAKAYSVASFYVNFSFEAKGKYVIRVCDGGVKEVRFTYHGRTLRAAAVSGLANAELLLSIKAGEAHYDFVEVMACRRESRRAPAFGWLCSLT